MVCYVAFSCGKISRFFPNFPLLLIEFLLMLYLLCNAYVVCVEASQLKGSGVWVAWGGDRQGFWKGISADIKLCVGALIGETVGETLGGWRPLGGKYILRPLFPFLPETPYPFSPSIAPPPHFGSQKFPPIHRQEKSNPSNRGYFHSYKISPVLGGNQSLGSDLWREKKRCEFGRER